MVERANVMLMAISSTLESWAREEERMARSPDFYSTGEYFLGVLLQCHRAQTLSEKFFSHPLQTMNTGIVAALFIAVVLNLLGNVACLPCNFVLRMMKVAIGTFLQDLGDIDLFDNLPTDIRTTRKRFDLNPSLMIFASCPTCYFAHPPIKRSGSNIDIYRA
jgi:hypothetical protein